jgi:type I restriction enzyme S subunit
MSFPRYPAYQDSGVEWLGEVPAHWHVFRLRFTAELNPSKSEAASLPRDADVSFLPMESVGDDGSLDLIRVRPIAEVESGYTYFREGDVTVAKITPCFENGKGAVMRGLASGIGFGTTELIVARPRRGVMTSDWLNLIFRSQPFRRLGEAAMYGAGGQKRVPDDFVREFRIGVPPIAEQTAIAAFLGRETAKIDALVAEQEKLIELLKEKRQAVISHAVTKGLDPNVPMKDSGVEWLGEVPAHWDVVPLMWLTHPNRPIMYGIVLPGPDVGEGIPILKGGNVRPERLRLDSLARTTPDIEAPYARARLRVGDLVYSIRGTIGDCELVPPELDGCNITQDVARVSPDDGIDHSWLRFALLSRAVAEDLACGSLGAAVRGVNIFDLKRARIPVPPSDERRLIASFISTEVANIDGLTEAALTSISILRERRSALISAAVTGQIDVRSLSTEQATATA